MDCPLVKSPFSVPTSSAILVIAGVPGAAKSTTTLKMADGALTLPAASVAVTVRLCEPLLNAVGGVKLQVPPAPTVAVPSGVGLLPS